MSESSTLTPIESADVARTNLLTIKGEVRSHIQRILRRETDCLKIATRIRLFRKKYEESVDAFWKRVHTDIKRIIRQALGLSARAPIQYETYHNGPYDRMRVYAFFLAPTSLETPDPDS